MACIILMWAQAPRPFSEFPHLISPAHSQRMIYAWDCRYLQETVYIS